MKGYRTKKISLPGGRVIEIVYFSEPTNGDDDSTPTTEQRHTPARRVEPGRPGHRGLHTCEQCEGGLVYPVAWEERSGDRWRIERRCPSCEWRHVGEFHQSEVETFDDVLNEGTEDLLVSLRTFSRSNMEADIERIIEALQLDLIEPMDF
jgi:hypothetical protein